MSQVMVTIRFDGDADELFSKWQRAVELWEEEFETVGPATVGGEGRARRPARGERLPE